MTGELEQLANMRLLTYTIQSEALLTMAKTCHPVDEPHNGWFEELMGELEDVPC
jgi:hypothetical protein